MNNDLETIENYLTGGLSADERTRFEATLRTDPALADALAFYALAQHTAKVDARAARARRQAELDALRRSPVHSPWAAPMRWVAAASVVLLLGLGWYFMRGTLGGPDAAQLADAYVSEQFTELPTSMGDDLTDSLTLGVGLYNKENFAQAEAIFGDIVARQPGSDRALRFAGVAALRQHKYDQAIDRFRRLSQRTDLTYNDGPFLEAIALLRRNRPMDKSRAEKLLNDIVNRNLAGEERAKALLDQF